MKKRKYSYTELGMLLGLFVGGGLATILFTTTGKAVYFAIVGVGLALGLGLGAAFDGARSTGLEGKGQPKSESEG
jgi:hypothetical protein